MATNITWWDTADNPADVVTGVINATNGRFMIGLMISLFLILFIALRARNRELDEIFILTGAVEFMLAVFGIALQWIAFYWLFFGIALLFTGIMVRLFGQ